MIPSLLLAASAAAPLQDTSRAPLLDHRQIQVAMARIATEHKDLASVLPVGAQPSRGGRAIEALRIAAGTPEAGRPAILLVAGLDGPRAWTSGLVLDHARKLVERYATDEGVRRFLDTTTLYVIPRANPDACEARFFEPLAEVRATGSGRDDDRDGRQGEDPPGDVDGDGKVTWMRVPDPDGEWVADPSDPRATIRADRSKGERGLWKLVREGRDADRDETASEDAEHDAVVDRNFPHGWVEHGAESGRYPTEEPEARDLCDFVLEHRGISLVLVYGELDDLTGKPKTVKDDAPRARRIPPEGMPESDAALLEEIGRRYAKIGESTGKGEGDEAGTFAAWCRYDRGLWTIGVSLWSIPLDAKPAEGAGEEGADKKDAKEEKKKKDEPAPSDEAKRLRWVDALGESERFLPWKAFEHPELGPVEIGGWAPYARTEPPTNVIDAIADRELELLVLLSETIPRVAIAECTATDLGGGVWRIDAAIANEALLPLMSVAGRRSEVVRPARMTLVLPQEARLLAGNRDELVRDLPGSGGRKELRWLVLGATPASLAVEVETDHAGAARAVPEVK